MFFECLSRCSYNWKIKLLLKPVSRRAKTLLNASGSLFLAIVLVKFQTRDMNTML